MAVHTSKPRQGMKRQIDQESDTLQKKRPRVEKPEVENAKSEIRYLENSILESRKNYNNIVKLFDYLADQNGPGNYATSAAVALCRVFCRLIALDELGNRAERRGDDATVARWLNGRLESFKKTILQMLTSKDHSHQLIAIAILMQLLKGEGGKQASPGSIWVSGLFSSIVETLVSNATASAAREEFVVNYVSKYSDIRYHTFSWISDLTTAGRLQSHLPQTLSVLSAIRPPSDPMNEGADFYLTPTAKIKRSLQSSAGLKKIAQKAWIGIIRQNLSKGERKQILEIMTHRIAPWFLKPEMLLDFLTDSFNIGGSTSLLALSGLFRLIEEKNLDYPQFYEKLYTLLHAEILHSKHRSRFFRLLDVFLGSSHLPAALVSSFIKRLSRLSLHAPPSAIVVVIPWVYNLLQKHPTCTFLLHRVVEKDSQDGEQWVDPFNAEESDPMSTSAINSSLWELHTLQSHYHPNVAAIARIISEQFTKQAYNLEDFLDHSYATMFDMELAKDVKKLPAVEYEIPKGILTRRNIPDGSEESLLVQMWQF